MKIAKLRLGRWVSLVLVMQMLWTGAAVAAQRATEKAPPADAFYLRPRVVILSDIGNEPDDQMSFVRLMLYSNELDIEAMIAATSTWQRTTTHPETMHAIVRAYGRVRHNLMLNAKGWPTEKQLSNRIFAGQPGYGMADVGPGKDSPGSRALVKVMEQKDKRPLWICIWAGANTLAQALLEVRASHTPEETRQIVSRLRVYSISDQDDAGPWIRREFPTLDYIVTPSLPNSNSYYHATWTGISGDFYYRNCAGADSSVITHQWLAENIRKGPLGKMYPKYEFIMEGDTPSFLGLINNGLDGYLRPDWGGWGGRYVWLRPYGETHAIWTQGGDEFFRTTSQDRVIGVDGRAHVSDQATIWRWRKAFQDDFAARMDWTVEDFAHANHAPELVVNGQGGTAPIEIMASVGQTITLDAKGSHDPDKGQTLRYQWWVYPEAGLDGTHGADVSLTRASGTRTQVVVHSACRQGWITGLVPCRGAGVAHIILQVTDDGTPPLTSYRRVIVHVTAENAGNRGASGGTK
jgi:hypothetical protein